MMKKEEKIKQVEAISKELSSAVMIVFTDFQGMNVASSTALRRKCRTASVGYRVLKNTLAERALDGLQVKGLGDVLKGSTALAIGFDDPVMAAKVIHEFSATDAKLKIKGGLMGKQKLTAAEVVQLAKLPSRQVLLAQLAGTMNAPVRNLAYVLSGVIRKLVTGLKAVEEKKQKS